MLSKETPKAICFNGTPIFGRHGLSLKDITSKRIGTRKDTSITPSDRKQPYQQLISISCSRPHVPIMSWEPQWTNLCRNNLLIPTLEVRINQAAKLRGDFAQMVHSISRNFTIRDTNQIMEHLILRCQGDLNVYIQNEMLMHNHCMEIVGSLGLKMLDAMLSVDD